MRPLLILATLFLFFSWTLGCGTVGKDFDMEQAKTIQNGITTREDIALMFGKPFKVGVQNSHPIWVYEENKYRALGDDSSKSLIVEFDDNGVVRNHAILSSEPIL